MLDRDGMIYIVYQHETSVCKIGYWSSSVRSLYDRYSTGMGPNIVLYYCLTPKANLIELDFQARFKSDCFAREIFFKNKMHDYVNYIQETCNSPIKHYVLNQYIDRVVAFDVYTPAKDNYKFEKVILKITQDLNAKKQDKITTNENKTTKQKKPISDNEKFKCDRCGCSSTSKQNLISHLMRQKRCLPIVSTTSRESQLLNMIKVNDESAHGYCCKFCNSKFKYASGLSRHKNTCKDNEYITLKIYIKKNGEEEKSH